MTNEIINGVRVSGYTKKEDVHIQAPGGKEFLGTRVTMPTGASIFLKADKEVVAENLKRNSSIDFGDYSSVNAHNLYGANISGVPEKADFINLWDCENVNVDVENIMETKKKQGKIDFDADGNPKLQQDNDTVMVRYTNRQIKSGTNSIQANPGDNINKETVEKSSFVDGEINK